MDPFTRIHHPGGAQKTTLTAQLAANALSGTVADGSTFSSNPQIVTINRGQDTEEAMLVTFSGNTFTCRAIADRGIDGTPPSSHEVGETVEVTFTAQEADEANQTATQTLGQVFTKGDLLVGSGLRKLGVVSAGADGQPIKADSTSPQGLSYGSLAQAVTHASPDTDSATTALHHTLGTGTNQAAQGSHDHGTAAAWTTYPSTWTAAGGNGNIGNGTLRGRYKRLGSTVHAAVTFIAGSTTTFGSGVWHFALPFNAHVQMTGCGYIYQSATGTYRPIACYTPGQVLTPVVDGGLATATVPWTWTNGDQMFLFITFETDSP